MSVSMIYRQSIISRERPSCAQRNVSAESSVMSTEPAQWELLMRRYSTEHKLRSLWNVVKETSKADIDNSLVCQEVFFPTGSSYRGPMNSLGMQGYGVYTYPHGVVYEGHFLDGVFHGPGELQYPSGVVVRGRWRDGVLRSTNRTTIFPDGVVRGGENWEYCRLPDRRLGAEHKRCAKGAQRSGLMPAGKSIIKQDDLEIPYGTYDTGSNIYDPATRATYSYHDIELETMTRALDDEETNWIAENCPKNPVEVVGPRPDLYEVWWNCKDTTEEDHDWGRESMQWNDWFSSRMSMAETHAHFFEALGDLDDIEEVDDEP